MMKQLFVGVVLTIASFVANAEEKAYKPYFVSGILKQGTEGMTLKIIQAMVISDSTESAQLVFTVLATKQFPGGTLVSVLATDFEQLLKASSSSSNPKPLLGSEMF